MAVQSQPWRDEDRVRELYLEQDLTQQEVAEELGCGHSTIGEWMERFGIEKDDPTYLQEADRVVLNYLQNELAASDQDLLYIKSHEIPFETYTKKRRGQALSRLSQRDDVSVVVEKWGGKASQTWTVQERDSE